MYVCMYVCMYAVDYLGTVCDEDVRVLLQSVIVQLHRLHSRAHSILKVSGEMLLTDSYGNMTQAL